MKTNKRIITTKVIQDNNDNYAIIKRKLAEFFASKYKDFTYGNHSSGRE